MAYRVIGPFTTGGFAGGAYCVGAALIPNREVARIELGAELTMRNPAGKEFEADFGMLAKPSRLAIRPRRI